MPTEREPSPLKRLRRPALGLLIALAAAIILVYLLGSADTYENTGVSFALNFIFVTSISVVVAWVLAFSFVRTLQWHLLFIGTAHLVVGITSSIAYALIQEPDFNAAVTVHCIGVLAAGMLLMASLFLFLGSKRAEISRRGIIAAQFYVLSLSFIGLLVWAATSGHTIPFLLQDGFTVARQAVLGTGLFLFIAAALTYGAAYRRSRSTFIYWYSLALGAFSLGIISMMLTPAIGSLLSWLGRGSQLLSGVYLLTSALVILREARTQGTSVRELVAEYGRRAKLNYELLVNSASDAIVAIDWLGRILAWNQAAVKMFGYSRDDVIGTSFAELFVSPEQVASYKEVSNEATLRNSKPGSAVTVELEARRKNGEDFQIELTWLSGEPLAGHSSTMLVIRDITERKKIEQIKDEFIGMVSHELKTPLTMIMGSLYTLTAAGLSESESQELLSGAIGGSHTLANIVENLLELSRSQANRLMLHTERADIGQIALEVILKLHDKSAIHQLAVDLPKGMPSAIVDPIRVERVIFNLVENAIKYSPKGGEVTISARQQDGNMVICVSDQGPGISVEDQKKLFQSFEQLDISNRHAMQGVGLGLRVCRVLVEAHGGKIWVESEQGKGTSFYFGLPTNLGGESSRPDQAG